MLPPNFFLKWCNFVGFRVYFAAILSEKIENGHIKIIDIYYCALYLGVLEHNPECLFIVQFGESWNILSENVLLRKSI